MLRIRFRPSPATVIASVALLVALGGTGVAAISLPARSVGTAQLKTGAVTHAKLGANAVTTTNVKNGSLLKADFKAGQVPSGPPGAPGAPGAKGPTGPAGPAGSGATFAEKVVTSGSAQQTTSAAFIDLSGASTTIDVPSGQTATIVARYTAESLCYGGGSGAWCSVRILLDGNEMQPAVGTDFAFDSTNGGNNTSANYGARAVIRVATGVAAGTHTVKVQWGGVAGTPTFRLDDWALDVSAVKP